MKLRFRNYIIVLCTIILLNITLPRIWPFIFSSSWSDLKQSIFFMLIAICCVEIVEQFKSK